MKSFTYTLQNEFPMLLGSAGHLAHLASSYPDTTGTLEMGTRRADLSSPLKVMAMGIRKCDQVTISVEGPSEVELFDVLCNHFSSAM
jgi:phosphotransferase system HPr (HPr) family protein